MQTVFWPLGLATMLALPAAAQGANAPTPTSPPTLLSASPNGAPAAPPATAGSVLSLADALALALRGNPELAAATHELGAADGALRQAGAARNPELSLLIEDQQAATRSTTLQWSQPLELGGKRAARVAVAALGRDGADAALAARRANVTAAVMADFAQAQLAQERSRLALATLELARLASAAAAKRVAAGKISPVEESKARVAEAGVRLELSQAKAELLRARGKLASNWGATTVQFASVETAMVEPAPPPTLAQLTARLERAPQMARARSELARSQAELRLEKARRTPDVTLLLGAKRNAELGRNQAIFGLSVPLPLFDSNQGNVQAAASRSEQARSELDATAVRLHGQLLAAHGSWTGATEQAQLYRDEILPGATSAYAAAVKGFEFGKFSFLEVLDAQRTLFDAQSGYLRALTDIRLAHADLHGLLGGAPDTPTAEQP